MTVGILHLADSSWGGVYQYSLSVIEALLDNEQENQYLVVRPGSDVSNIPQDVNVIAIPPEGFLLGKVLRGLYLQSLKVFPFPVPLIVPFRLTRLGRWGQQQKVVGSLGLDLLICPVPTIDAYRLARHMKVPYVIVIHDLMHKHDTATRYPWKERALRDYVYEKGAQNSALTVVTSEQSQWDLHKSYGIPLEKIRILPTSVPPYIYQYKVLTKSEVAVALERFNLPGRYIFYPAQFWRHKNHARLVKAIHLIKQEHGVEIPVVFVGEPKEAFKEVMSLIGELDLNRQTFYLGFVSEKEMVALYKGAIALVMPSLHQINNLPLVEALVLGTCCLCANFDASRKQVEDAGLFFDPNDEKDIADKIWHAWNDDSLRRRLTNNGKRQAEEKYTQAVFAHQWRQVVEEAIDTYRSAAMAAPAKEVP